MFVSAFSVMCIMFGLFIFFNIKEAFYPGNSEKDMFGQIQMCFCAYIYLSIYFQSGSFNYGILHFYGFNKELKKCM